MTLKVTTIRRYSKLSKRFKTLEKQIKPLKEEIKAELDDNKEIMVGDFIVVKQVAKPKRLDVAKLAILTKERHKIDLAELIQECKSEGRRETLRLVE